MAQSPWSPEPGAPRVFPCRLVSFCCSLALIAVGMSVGRFYPRAVWHEGWPWLQQASHVGVTPGNWSSLSGALVPAESTFWVCLLWSLSGGAPLWFEVGHQVCWFWSTLGRALLQTHISHYKVICGWLSLVLGLEALGRNCAANQGSLLVVPGLEPFGGHHSVSWGQLSLRSGCGLVGAMF